MFGVSGNVNRTAFFLVFAGLSVILPLFFISNSAVLFQVLNFSSILVIIAAFEFGYALSYIITIMLSLIVVASMFFFKGHYFSHLISLLFLYLTPLVPSYCGRLHSEYISSKGSQFEKSKISFEKYKTGFTSLKETNISLQNQVNDISDLYEVTKKIGSSLSMTDALLIFKEAVSKVLNFKKAKIILIDASQAAVSVAAFEIHNSSHKKPSALDIKNVALAQFDHELSRAILKKREIIYLRNPIGEISMLLTEKEGKEAPFRDYFDVKEGPFAAFPLLSEGVPIGVFTISGVKEEQIEKLSVLTEQLALMVKKINLYEKVAELAITDGLTGIYVRRHFLERLKEEFSRIKRHKLQLSILMIDLDHFKRCNDTYGHLVGDVVLKELARILKEQIRQVDLSCRYGGEEFMIALPDTDKKSAIYVADRIRESIEKHIFKAYDETISMTISVGVSTYPDDGEETLVLIDHADQALYEAKAQGRNKVIYLPTDEIS